VRRRRRRRRGETAQWWTREYRWTRGRKRGMRATASGATKRIL
jgi:hypothetical protein